MVVGLVHQKINQIMYLKERLKKTNCMEIKLIKLGCLIKLCMDVKIDNQIVTGCGWGVQIMK